MPGAAGPWLGRTKPVTPVASWLGYTVQPRGSSGGSCQSSGRQARRTAFSSCSAGSTRGASTRTTTTCGPGAVAPALPASA
jgi:hypothetical protein